MNSMANAQKQLIRILPQAIKHVGAFSSSASSTDNVESKQKNEPATNETQNSDNVKPNLKPTSARYAEFEKKLRAKTPLGKLDELSTHPYQEKEPLKPWPNNTNPHTGEIGGPAGPEPTRYGDWERKGRVTDF